MTSSGDVIPNNIFRRVEHIGIAVRNLDEADKHYSSMLGVSRYKTEEVPSEGVRTAFYQVGETKIELLEATNPESPIARFIEKRGPGIHHIAFDVEDIRQSMRRLVDAGFILTSDTPKPGADNKLVCFVHPKSTGGALIELCQEMPKELDDTSISHS
jgi:methylmalonyl-CoA/ethylmalonyl-CoA epimerase